VATVFLIALAEFGIRMANDFEVAGLALLAPAPAILALSLIGPAALFLDLRGRARLDAAAVNAGVQSTGPDPAPIARGGAGVPGNG
jgi:hypothetical protein